MNKEIEIPFKITLNDDMRVFRVEKNQLSRDILNIAFALFNFEKELKDKNFNDILIVRTKLLSYMNINSSLISKEIEKIFLDILNYSIKIKFIPNANKDCPISRKDVKLDKYDTLCLFSGGVDSFTGIFESKKKFGNVLGICIEHTDQSRLINITKRLVEDILTPNNIKCNFIYVPPIHSKINKKGYSQLRGLLYLLSAGSYIDLVKAKRIIITECGSTMYQPKYGLYDTVTSTTHPYILKTGKKLLEIILNRKIDLIIPFEDMTKAEIIVYSSSNKYLDRTYSCISSMLGKHCGTCYGCVLRKLGAILANVKDCEYNKDILFDETANLYNLIAMIKFANFYLTNKDLVEKHTLQKIKEFNKENLYQRQSLDLLASLYLLKKKKKIKFSSRVEKLYENYVKPINPEILEKRIKDVLSKSKKPNFNKKVI